MKEKELQLINSHSDSECKNYFNTVNPRTSENSKETLKCLDIFHGVYHYFT